MSGDDLPVQTWEYCSLIFERFLRTEEVAEEIDEPPKLLPGPVAGTWIPAPPPTTREGESLLGPKKVTEVITREVWDIQGTLWLHTGELPASNCLQAELQTLGQQGWELVSVNDQNGVFHDEDDPDFKRADWMRRELFFKRPVRNGGVRTDGV